VCCEEQGLPPTYTQPERMEFLPPELREELAFHLAEEVEVGFTRHQRGLPCIWHDAGTGRCRHYQLRPPICREVPIGGDSCLFWRARRPLHRAPGGG